MALDIKASATLLALEIKASATLLALVIKASATLLALEIKAKCVATWLTKANLKPMRHFLMGGWGVYFQK